VIPTFCRADLLVRAIESARSQGRIADEILVVHDGKEMAGPEVDRLPSGEQIRHLWLGERTGFAGAANAGFAEAKCDYVLLINDDVTLAPDCIEKLRQALQAHREAGSAAAKVLRKGEQLVLDSAGHGLTVSGYTFNRGAGAGAKDSGWLGEEVHVFGAPASACMYRRDMLREIGFFDSSFGWYLEDLDLSFRSQLWGYKCIYAPDAVAYHQPHSSTGSMYNGDTVYHIAKNTLAVLLKNMPRSLLKKNVAKIAVFLIMQQAYHLLRTGNGLAYSRGVRDAIRQRGHWIAKRKRILGGRRIDDHAVETLLASCRQDAKEMGSRWR